MKKAKDVMKTDVIAASPYMAIKDIARLMVDNKISGLPVVDDSGDIVGVVSENNMMRQSIKPNMPSAWKLAGWMLNEPSKVEQYISTLNKWKGETAREIMTTPAITVDVNDDLEKVGRLMLEREIKRVFVTERRKLVGVISRSVFVELLLNA